MKIKYQNGFDIFHLQSKKKNIRKFSILIYIFFSGQVHIISSDRDESDDDFVAAASPPRCEMKPNTKELDVSIEGRRFNKINK